ncbi:MAG: hypothetical protein HOP33_21880 [Verrucomicrobia bacterium]|nr:hypothetical protein [Verrucomicrobiota bacterium]
MRATVTWTRPGIDLRKSGTNESGNLLHTRAAENHHAETRHETTEEKARRILNEELDKLG